MLSDATPPLSDTLSDNTLYFSSFLKHFTMEVRACCLAEPSCYLLHSQVNTALKCTYVRVHGNLRASTCFNQWNLTVYVMHTCEIYHGRPLEVDGAVVQNWRKIDQIVVFFNKIASLRWTELNTWCAYLHKCFIPNFKRPEFYSASRQYREKMWNLPDKCTQVKSFLIRIVWTLISEDRPLRDSIWISWIMSFEQFTEKIQFGF